MGRAAILHEKNPAWYGCRVPYRDFEPLSKQVTIVVGLTVVGFMAFGLALSFYRNLLFEETLVAYEGQNQKLRDHIDESRGDLDYYRSKQFKDKYAKENLGKVNPGEKVLVFTEGSSDVVPIESGEFTPTEAQQALYEEILRQMPVIEHWNLYLFHRDRIDDLKRSL